MRFSLEFIHGDFIEYPQCIYLWRNKIRISLEIHIFWSLVLTATERHCHITMCSKEVSLYYISFFFFFFVFFIYLFFIIDLIVAFIQNSYTHSILFDYFLFNVKFIPSWIYVTLRVYFAKCAFFSSFLFINFILFFLWKTSFQLDRYHVFLLFFFFLFFFYNTALKIVLF